MRPVFVRPNADTNKYRSAQSPIVNAMNCAAKRIATLAMKAATTCREKAESSMATAYARRSHERWRRIAQGDYLWRGTWHASGVLLRQEIGVCCLPIRIRTGPIFEPAGAGNQPDYHWKGATTLSHASTRRLRPPWRLGVAFSCCYAVPRVECAARRRLEALSVKTRP